MNDQAKTKYNKRQQNKLNKTKKSRQQQHKSISNTFKTLSNNYTSFLREIYPICVKDKNDNYTSPNRDLDGYKITYGEMTYEGMDELYNYLYVTSKIQLPQYFLDVGSGRGKLCLFLAAKEQIVKSIGIELVKERHDDAIVLKNTLSEKGFLLFTNKTVLLNNDFFKVTLPNKLFIEPFTYLVWISNLCFDSEHTDNIFIKLINELPINSIICCSKPYNGDNLNLELIGSIPIEMSWNNNSNVSIYRLRGGTEIEPSFFN
jgi:tRNA G46 methylase TrmB